MTRLMSSQARRRSAALSTDSGIFFSFSFSFDVEAEGSRCRREKYMSRWRCGGNHGSKDVAFPEQRQGQLANVLTWD